MWGILHEKPGPAWPNPQMNKEIITIGPELPKGDDLPSNHLEKVKLKGIHTMYTMN